MARLINRGLKILLSGLLLLSAQAFADSQAWAPLDPQELRMTEFKPLPGVDAVLLYYADEIDDVEHQEFFYSRIKILTDSGKRFATVEIPLVDKASITDLRARTVHPDGSITEFFGQPFEKVVLRGHRIKIRLNSFTLANVTPGSIIEYKYELHYGDKGLRQHEWEVQHDLFAVKQHLSFRFNKHNSVEWVATRGFDKSPTNDLNPGTLQMDVDNIPPFEPEEHMPPPSAYRLKISFFYTSADTSSASEYWFETGRLWSRSIDTFIGNHKEIKQAADEAAGNETDPEKKLRRLYARAQQIRNLSYEPHFTAREKKLEELKDPKDVVDILKHGYGNRNGITVLFVAMARSLGFRASVVLVSNRESRFFDRDVLSFAQLDSEIALVQVNGKSVFLDPGTQFCPYGLLRWMRTGTAAMDMREPGDIFATPPVDLHNSRVSRSANIRLNLDGSIKGEIRVEFSGIEALELRLSALGTDDAGRKKMLEQQVKDWLPRNATVHLTASAGWENEDQGLVAVFDAEIPEYAAVAGKRLLVPEALFKPKKSRVLKSGPRKYPVYYRYALSEADSVVLTVPSGYTTETIAAPASAMTDFATFNILTSSVGQTVNMERTLRVNVILFPADRYEQLRDFFAKVEAADESQTVLREAPAQAQMSN